MMNAIPLFLALSAPAMVTTTLQEVERVERSQLAPIQLPSGTLRFTDAASLEKFDAALQQVAKTNQGRMAAIEVLVWSKDNAGAARKALPDRLKDAGYSYVTGSAFDSEAGKVTPVGSARKAEPGGLLGMWIEAKDKTLLLVWGRHEPDGAAATPAVKPEPIGPDREILPEPAPAPVKSSPVVGGKAPADMQGSWSWTTISSVNYRNTTTNQLTEPSGMSAKFTFRKDGTYSYLFFIHQRTYGLVSEATTTEEGRAVFRNDGTFVLNTAHGHYKGISAGKLIDREMTESERTKPKTYYWEWRTVDGKRQLYIGPGRASMSLFKRDE